MGALFVNNQVHNAGKQKRGDSIHYIGRLQCHDDGTQSTQSNQAQRPDNPRLVKDSQEEANNYGTDRTVRGSAREGRIYETLAKCKHRTDCSAECKSSQQRERDNYPNLEMGATPRPHLHSREEEEVLMRKSTHPNPTLSSRAYGRTFDDLVVPLRSCSEQHLVQLLTS